MTSVELMQFLKSNLCQGEDWKAVFCGFIDWLLQSRTRFSEDLSLRPNKLSPRCGSELSLVFLDSGESEGPD